MELKTQTAPMQIRDYGLMVTKCRIVSQTLEEAKRLREYQQKRRSGNNLAPRGRNFKPGQSSSGSGRGGTSSSNQSVCPRCGKNHASGPCPNFQPICYRCQRPGNLAKECRTATQNIRPSAQSVQPETLRPQVQGRVFAIENRGGRTGRGRGGRGKGVGPTPNVLQGEGEISGHVVSILFDSGASHSFISQDCCKRLNLSVQYLPYDLNVSTPVGNANMLAYVCNACPIRINSCLYTVNLVCLPMNHVDVILGMDWLAENSFMLNCTEGMVECSEASDKGIFLIKSLSLP